jgi:integrase
MALKDLEIRKAKPQAKPYKLSDEKGLFLLVHPNGSRYWRQKYRFDGKEKLLSHGSYPEVSLSDARERRDNARKMLASGVDPGEHQKAKKAARVESAANSFEVIAREWFGKFSPNWAETHSQKIIRRLEADVFPWIGNQPVNEIKAMEILAVVSRIHKRGALDTAHRAKQNIGQVMRYATVTGRAERDPTVDLRGALPTPEKKHYAAFTETESLGEFLRAIDGCKGSFVVLAALRIAPFLFVRPGELRQAEWSEIDLEKAEWRYFVTKTRREHLVPLAKQVITILRDLYPLTGSDKYVFPGARAKSKPMSNAAVNSAIRRMGYDTKTEITGHGFRAVARTFLAEELHEKPEVIEHQLAHKVPDILGTAYNRTKFLKERRVMMQLWADYLDKLKA